MRIPVAIGAVVLVLTGAALGGVLSGALTSSDSASVSRTAAAATADDDPKVTKDQKDQVKADKHRRQRAFVTAKKAWSACADEAEPRRRSDRFDHEQACGAKPHPHFPSGKPGHDRSS